MVWNIQGTVNQQRIVRDALDRCDFPFDRLLPELRSEVNKSQIPVEWADLSRYAQVAQVEEIDVPRMHDEEPQGEHDHTGHDHGDSEVFHTHITDPETGEEAHGIGFRNRVLGLAWYSGKVTLDISMESNEELAHEVFLSEGAHMVDFFYMTDEHRRLVWNAVHTDVEDLPEGINIEDGINLGHNHGWFDVGGYYSWVGEAFMGLFVKAFSDVPVTIPFNHPATPEAVREVRFAFLGDESPQPEEPVEEPTAPEGPSPDALFFGLDNSEVFHDSHKKVSRQVTWDSFQAAIDAGRRPCKVCKPQPN